MPLACPLPFLSTSTAIVRRRRYRCRRRPRTRFCAGLLSPALAGAMREVSGAAPWAPVVLGGQHRAQMLGPAAASEASAPRRRSLQAKLDQLPLRAAIPPHHREALRAHLGDQLEQCSGPASCAPPHAPPADGGSKSAPPRPRARGARGAGGMPLEGAPSPGGRRPRPQQPAPADAPPRLRSWRCEPTNLFVALTAAAQRARLRRRPLPNRGGRAVQPMRRPGLLSPRLHGPGFLCSGSEGAPPC